MNYSLGILADNWQGCDHFVLHIKNSSKFSSNHYLLRLGKMTIGKLWRNHKFTKLKLHYNELEYKTTSWDLNHRLKFFRKLLLDILTWCWSQHAIWQEVTVSNFVKYLAPGMIETCVGPNGSHVIYSIEYILRQPSA